MIKHIVMFRFAGTVTERQQAAQQFKQLLDKLPSIIPQLLSIEVGLNTNPKEDYDLVLTATAKSHTDVAAYSAHQAHQEAVDTIRSRIASRACVDFEI